MNNLQRSTPLFLLACLALAGCDDTDPALDDADAFEQSDDEDEAPAAVSNHVAFDPDSVDVSS